MWDPHSGRERILSEHRDIRNFLGMPADQAVRGERVAQSKLPEEECHTRMLLEGQKDILSEARSEMDWQDLRDECADRALHESGPRLHPKGWNFTRRINNLIQSQREKSSLCTELDRRERFLQESRVRSLQAREELPKCCTEAERAKQLRIDELSFYEKERKSTVNLLMVQIQELQDKVNS